MAYFGNGYASPSGSVFGGFPGGYNQTPDGFLVPSNFNVYEGGASATPIGSFAGAAQYSLPTTVINPQMLGSPVGTGLIDPNLGMGMAPAFSAGF